MEPSERVADRHSEESIWHNDKVNEREPERLLPNGEGKARCHRGGERGSVARNSASTENV